MTLRAFDCPHCEYVTGYQDERRMRWELVVHIGMRHRREARQALEDYERERSLTKRP